MLTVFWFSSDIAMGAQPEDDIEPSDSVSNQLSVHQQQLMDATRRGSDMSGVPGTTVTEILEIPDHTRLEQAYHDQLEHSVPGSSAGVPPVHPTESVRSLGDIHVNHNSATGGSLTNLPQVSQHN